MKVTGDWLTRPATQAVFAALAGHRVLAVGGCVRNALMFRPVADIDMATDARPPEVIAAVERAGLRAVPTGIDHGTVTVVSGGIPHEVTTFRRDVETDGHHAVVAFTDDVAEDAARRDFTMNALYCDAQGTVIDPLGGLPDLTSGRVRFVGDPAARIAEDHLRILRFFRFHAHYAADGIDAEGQAASAAMAEGIDTLSRERIGAEMRKLLSAPDPAPAVAAMAQAGILARVLPGADPLPLALMVHVEQDAQPAWLRRLAAIGGEDAEARLRLSRAEARDLAALRAAIGSGESPAVLGWRLGPDLAADAMRLRQAVLGPQAPALWIVDVSRGAQAAFPVTAADLMPALQGPALGARLAQLTDLWIASDLRLTRAELLAGS
ncbi:MAG: CCA tRNA nucleotidyltransferase [Gemmobacter sp.]